MITYRCDILELLKQHGYNTTRIKKTKVISEPVLHKLRHGELVKLDTINTICNICHCRIEDVLVFTPDNLEEDEDME